MLSAVEDTSGSRNCTCKGPEATESLRSSRKRPLKVVVNKKENKEQTVA